MRKLFILMVGALLTSGCASGYMYSSTYDPATNKKMEVVYSPLFFSDSYSLADGAEFKVSVVITRRVEPISYGLLASIGGLGPDDLESSATVVVHFKNDSQELYKIQLNRFNQGSPIGVPEIILKPGDRFSTREIPLKVLTYEKAFNLELDYQLNGRHFSQIFSLKRETVEDLRKKSRK